MRTWFANNKVVNFTISLWYQAYWTVRDAALVNNVDSWGNAGFSLSIRNYRTVVGKIRTESGERRLTVDIPWVCALVLKKTDACAFYTGSNIALP